MRTIEITAYQFAELSDKAKQKALESNYYINIEHTEWFDADLDDFETICSLLGIDLNKAKGRNSGKAVYFSGFSSQGDGACFEGSYSYKKGASKAIREHAPQDKKLHSIADQLQALQKRNFYSLEGWTKQYSHHYYSMSVGCERSDCKELASDTEDDFKSIMEDLADWLYRQLETEYEYQTSEAAIIETIEANEYEFDENGEML